MKKNNYLLNISDISKSNFFEILKYTKEINQNSENFLKEKNIGLIFEKNSTRTRLSFQAGINQLGGHFIDIKLDDLNLKRIESFEDTFEIMGCYLDALVFRTNDHKKLELAKQYFNKPIINALSNISHPCQAISDFYTLAEHFQRDDFFRIVWCGDMNNVLFSLLECIIFFDNTTIDIFTNENIFNDNQEIFPSSKNIYYHFEMDTKILKNADCIMTDVYNSMNDKTDKEPILKKFQVNKELMSHTNDKTVFMHCLPAKINSEVTADVIKGPKSIVVKQAENRLNAQKGILKWLDI